MLIEVSGPKLGAKHPMNICGIIVRGTSQSHRIGERIRMCDNFGKERFFIKHASSENKITNQYKNQRNQRCPKTPVMMR